MKEKAFTLIETIVAMLIIGIFFLGVITFFSNIARGFLFSKARVIAPALAQEKIEHFKGMRYHKVLPTPQSDVETKGYDNTYYKPEEGILVGGTFFDRYVLIRKVEEGSSGEIVELLPDHPDTGLKKITITVKWKEGGHEKSYILSSIISDPDRRPVESKIYGVVRTTFGVVIPSVRVFVIENPVYEDYTDEYGRYEIGLPTGTWTLYLTKIEYFDAKSAPITVSEGEEKERNFSMTKKGVAHIKSDIYKRTRILISEVCPGYNGDERLEYIELYNPTTSPFIISNETFKLKYVDWTNTVITIPLGFISTIIPTSGYFLIASTPVVQIPGATPPYNFVTANATFTSTGFYGIIRADKAGGICITDNYDVWIDSLAWGRSGVPEESAEAPPPAAKEGEGFRFSDRAGILLNNSLERICGFYESPSYGPSCTYGNALDNNDNGIDFRCNVGLANLSPQNITFRETPVSGEPVAGAFVYCDDGLSTPDISSVFPPGRYELSNVATGIWTISASSGNLYGELKDFPILIPGKTYDEYDRVHVILDKIAEYGYVTGIVRRKDTGAILAGIIVEAAGVATLTDAKGYYRLVLPPGDYETVTANPDNENPNFTSVSTTYSIRVEVGKVISGVDFYLSPGGSIRGRVVTQNNDPLSHYIVEARDVYDKVWTAISGEDGYFKITNLSVGTHRVKPLLDPGETSSPEWRDVTVSQGQIMWSSTFTIISAYGKFYGVVEDAGEKIATGVLIMASTMPISITSPPVIDEFVRNNRYYHSVISNEKGIYELPVRGLGPTVLYNIVAWYTKSVGENVVTKAKTYQAYVKPGQSVNVNFTGTW